MIILVIGPDNGAKREIVSLLSTSKDLKVHNNYVFKSSSVKDLEPGIYTSNTLMYQQAKKMRADAVISTFEPFKVHKAAKFYKLVDAVTGETLKDEKGNFYDKLSLKQAFSKQSELNKPSKIRRYEI